MTRRDEWRGRRFPAVRDNGRVSVYRDDGIVLRTHKLGEADRIVTLLGRRTGRVRAVAKGVRRTKSRFGARLEPFTHVDLQLYTGRSLDVITQAETLRPYGEPLAADYPRYTTGTAMLETAERFTPVEKEPALRQFLLLVGGLRALGEGVHDPRLVLDAYLLRSLAVAGYAPALDECAICGTRAPRPAPAEQTGPEPGPGQEAGPAPVTGRPARAPAAFRAFAIPAGGLVCRSCRAPGAATPSAQTIALMSALMSGDWPHADASERRHQVECSGLVAAYLQWHLEHSIRSLKHVEHA
jgi:DNA repair protein RecO (recombination protein O)